MNFLFIKDLGKCHEEPLTIIHFNFLYSISTNLPRLFIHYHLHPSLKCIPKSSPSLHLLHPSMKRCLPAARQEPTAGRKDMLLFIHKKEQGQEAFHSTHA